MIKWFAAILLAVAFVNARSSYYYGWIPDKETVYQYESQVLTGIPDIDQAQYAGLRLMSKIRVQSFRDFTLRIKFEDPHFNTINGKVSLDEAKRIIEEGGRLSGQEQENIPEHFLRYLEEPFLVHVKRGVVESFFVSKEEPSVVTNIKKSALVQFQVDVSGSLRTEIESNVPQLPSFENDDDFLNGKISYFTVSEESLHGECLTEYTIHPLPKYRIKEIEESMQKEEKRHGVNPQWASKVCEGKKYFQITKTRDFDKCKVRPVYQKMVGLENLCDITKGECSDVFIHMSTSSYFVCGELSEFSIRKIVANNNIAFAPLGWKTKEDMKSMTRVTLDLVSQTDIQGKLPIPSNTKEVDTLTYEYPVESEYKPTEGKIKESEDITGIRPVLPQPDLTSAPRPLIPVYIPKEDIISQVVEALKRISQEVFESPESCSWKDDVAGYVTTIIRRLNVLSLQDLKELERKVLETVGHEPAMKTLFYDILSFVGTNPSTMFIIEKVKSSDSFWTMPRKSYVLQSTIRSIKYPTEELMGKLVEMVKGMQVGSRTDPKKDLLVPTIMQISNLFYKAYINPTTMITLFPTRIYGVFGTKDSTVLKNEYIPFLTHKLEDCREDQEELKLVYASALGKLGHMKVLKPLLRLASEEADKPMVRSLAIYSLKRVAKMNPTELKNILLATISNPVEHPEVRMAAVSVLPWAKPSTAELQKIAIRTWFEPSKQVASFIYSTLVNLAETEVPELKPIGIRAVPILSLIKPTRYGILFSQNTHSSKFVEYLKTVASQKITVVNSKEGLMPIRFTWGANTYGNRDSWIMQGLSLTSYTQGMDEIINQYIKYFTPITKVSQSVDEQLKKIDTELNLKKIVPSKAKTFWQGKFLGWETATLIDHHSIAEALERITENLENDDVQQFKYLHAMQLLDYQGLGTSDAGFPLYSEQSVPLVYTIHGEYSKEKTSELVVRGKFVPIINGKMQSHVGIISPFTKEFLASGVEISLHSSIPLEIEGRVTEQSQLELTFKMPPTIVKSGKSVENLHAFLIPYTVKFDMRYVKPISKSNTLKPIQTGKPLKEVDKDFGTSMGIQGHLKAESDVDYTDLYSYYEKIRQNNFASLLTVAPLVSTLKRSSTRITFKPSASETKELRIILKLSYKQPGQSGYETVKIGPLSVGGISGDELERKELHSIKKVLEKLEHGTASMLHVKVVGKGRYSEKSVSAGILIGSKQESEHQVKNFVAVDVKPLESPLYTIEYESEFKMPKLRTRWSLEELLSENPQMHFNGKISHGPKDGDRKVIKFDTVLTKTEHQKESVRESPEFKLCKKEESKGRMLSTICMEVRQQAAALDKMNLKIQYPEKYLESYYFVLAGQLLQSQFMYQMEDYNEEKTQTPPYLEIDTVFSRIGDTANTTIKTQDVHYKIKNIRLGEWAKYIFPISPRNYVSNTLYQKLTYHQVPASCRIEPHVISTFDNKTYPYTINDCYHVLMRDATKRMPVAVLTRTVREGDKKVVKVLAGTHEITILPKTSSEMMIKVGDRTVQLSRGQTFREKSSKTGEVIVEVKRYYDDVYYVFVPEQGLQVLTDGVHVEVVAPQLLHSRTAGLCGDLNGEKTVDVKSPQQCVMRTRYAALSYLLNKSGNDPSSYSPKCQGIPSQDRSEYEKEARECVKEKYIPTPFDELYHRINSLSRPVIGYHVVNQERGQICISKQKVKICSGSSIQPIEVKPKVVEFTCMPRENPISWSLLKRAESGETLYSELSVLPTTYSKTEYEPTACKPSSQYSTSSSRFGGRQSSYDN